MNLSHVFHQNGKRITDIGGATWKGEAGWHYVGSVDGADELIEISPREIVVPLQAGHIEMCMVADLFNRYIVDSGLEKKYGTLLQVQATSG